jgi:hypothetical protein
MSSVRRYGGLLRAGAAATKAHAVRLSAAWCATAVLVRCRLRLSVAAPERQAATAIAQSATLFAALVRLRRATKMRNATKL